MFKQIKKLFSNGYVSQELLESCLEKIGKKIDMDDKAVSYKLNREIEKLNIRIKILESMLTISDDFDKRKVKTYKTKKDK